MNRNSGCPERERHFVYQLHVDLPTGRMTYTGRTSRGLKWVRDRVSRKMARLMNGGPDLASDHARAVHLACAAAMTEGWPMSVELKGRAGSRAEALELERRLMEDVAPETSLNGASHAVAVDLFCRIIADHLRRQGLHRNRIQRVLAARMPTDRARSNDASRVMLRAGEMFHKEPVP